MIIGISGLAGAGKDTAADYLASKHNFAKIALADPLKRILKEVYNFSDTQLWGPSDKRNAPDTRYVRAAFDRHDWQEDPSNNKLWKCTRCQLGGVDATPECVVYLTPRFALQQLGTEWGRNCYENTWVTYGLRLSEELLNSDEGLRREPEQIARYTAERGLFYIDKRPRRKPYKGVVIPDVRFKNEVEAFRAAGAKLIRILKQNAGLYGAAGMHLSEQEQRSIPDSSFDAVLENNGTLEELYKKLDSTLKGWM